MCRLLYSFLPNDFYIAACDCSMNKYIFCMESNLILKYLLKINMKNPEHGKLCNVWS